MSRSTRRDRQRAEVVELFLSGQSERAAALGREHLDEFPDDDVVARVVQSSVA